LLAANPCPCGKFARRGRACECSSLQIRRYLAKLSGPLLDRIDLRLKVEAPTRAELSSDSSLTSAVMRERVTKARLISEARFASESFKINSQIPPNLLRDRFRPRKDALALLHTLLDSESITARGFHRAIRVAWSIADLSGVSTPGKEEVERALELRVGIQGE